MTPIPVAPMGRDFFSMEGLTVAALELLFSLSVAMRRRTRCSWQSRRRDIV
jgi:hypothetical protein